MSMWLTFSLHIWQEYQNVFNTQRSTSLNAYSLQSGWRVCDILSHLPDVIFLLLLSFGLSYVQLFVTPWTVACQAPLSSTISWNLLKFMFIESVMLSNHLLPLTIPCRPLLLLHSTFPSIRVFSNESALCIGGQSIGASASVLPVNFQSWFPYIWYFFDTFNWDLGDQRWGRSCTVTCLCSSCLDFGEFLKYMFRGFPGGSKQNRTKNPACQWRRH